MHSRLVVRNSPERKPNWILVGTLARPAHDLFSSLDSYSSSWSSLGDVAKASTTASMCRLPMSEEDTPLGIPYHRNAPDGHPYINLKLEPERELELPELQKSPILRDLVLTITRGN